MRCQIIVLVLVLASSARAQMRTEQHMVIGAGVDSCGTWNAERANQSRRNENAAWILGYVSAFNRYRLTRDGNVAKGIDSNGLIGWIDAFCASHPLNMIETAGAGLIEELRQKTGAR